MQVVLRKFNPDRDSGLIYSSYPKGVYYGSQAPINPTGDDKIKSAWFKTFHRELKNQIEGSTIIIACMSDDPDIILGYSIMTDTTLDFIYVKEMFRSQGIARLLLKNQKVEHYKNVTKSGHSILQKEGNKDGREQGIDADDRERDSGEEGCSPSGGS